ncbi:MAG: hypothetical protein LUE11_04915 [Clostridia bacterium]|nr:hypothetical protein [Clostridia bacterium]
MIGRYAKDREIARVAQICNMRNAAYWGDRDPKNHIEKETARRRGEKNFIPKRSDGVRVDVWQAYRRHQAKTRRQTKQVHI